MRHEPSSGGLAIEAKRLEKRFGGRRALSGIDLAVPPGTVYGLLGPNGAGKTTTVRILATLLAPDGGWARVAGHDVAAEPRSVRRAIALAGQSATVDGDLTGRENLVFLARLAGLGRAAAKARAAELLVFGGALAGSPHRYLMFILPGTLVMAVLLVSMYAGIGLSTDRSQGTSERFRSLPIWRLAPVTGALLGDIARYLLAAALVAGLGVGMGFRPEGGAPGMLAGIGLLLVFALALSWAWTTLGLLLRTPQAVMSTGTAVLFPLTLASNVFVAPRTMPGWLQAFVAVNPVSHLVTAERSLVNGHPALGQIAWVLLASAALAAVFAPVTARLYDRQR